MPYPASRRAELDWLRVLALLMLMVFHSAMGFGSWPWHVKDPHHNLLLDGFLDFLLRWRVALVFIVSGAALMLALQRRSAWDTMRERGLRLAVPLIFGMLVVVPPQVYYERVQAGLFHGSLLDFLPYAFNGFYPAGNLTWNHLWFIPYVLVLTVAALPFCLWARSSKGERLLEPLLTAAANGHLYWLAVVPLVLAQLALFLQGSDAHGLLNDAHGWMEFGTLFLLGAALGRCPELLAAIQRDRYASLALGILAYAALRLGWPAVGNDPASLPLASTIGWCCLSALNVLAWAMTAVGFLTRWFNRPSPLLAYAIEATLPVYILHQTFVIYAVFHLHHVNWPLALKIALTLAFAMAASLALYELAIRRSRTLRLLFGVKDRAAEIGPEMLLPAGRALTSRWRAPSS